MRGRLYWMCLMFAASSAHADANTVSLSVGSKISSMPAHYVSYTLDWSTHWHGANVQTFPLSDPTLQSLARSLSPALLRIGGTQADHAEYGPTETNRSAEHFLSYARMTEVLDFCSCVGCQVVFGLNALYGRVQDSDPWDASNTIALLQYTASKGYNRNNSLYGWEELNKRIPANTLAAQYRIVKQWLQKLWPDSVSRPSLIGPDDNFDAEYAGLLSSEKVAISSAN